MTQTRAHPYSSMTHLTISSTTSSTLSGMDKNINRLSSIGQRCGIWATLSEMGNNINMPSGVGQGCGMWATLSEMGNNINRSSSVETEMWYVGHPVWDG